MRKLTAILAVLMLCLQVFSGTVAYGRETGDYIQIESYSAPGTILAGDAFNFKVNIRNKSLAQIYEMYVDIDQSSDFYADPSYSNFFKTNLMGNEVRELTSTYKLVYKGTGNSLTLTFKYNIDGTDYMETHTMYISGAVPTGGSSTKPVLTVDNSGRIPVIAAGSAYQLKYKIKNVSNYPAKNVKVTLKMTDMSKAVQVLENYDLRQTVQSIDANSAKDVVFDINVYKTAPEGVFPLELKYEYDGNVSTETVYMKIENNNFGPRLTVDGISVKPSNNAAGTVMLELTLKNLGASKVEDVKMTLGGLKSGGFTAYNSSDVKYVQSINANSTTTVTYELLPPTSGAASSNELTVKFDYKDITGTEYSDQNQIFVPSGEGEGSRPNLIFDKIVSPQTAIGPDQDFAVELDLKNNGGAVARNIKVSLATDAGIVSRSMNPVYLTELGADKAEKVSFKLFAAGDVTTKNYPVALNVEYEDAFGNKFNASQYVGVFIENETGKTVPRIIINNYSMDPVPVNAGEDFTLKMSFLNTSKTVDVSNIKVTVTSDDGTFTPTDSGNTFYIEGIQRTQSIERELVLHVKPDAEQKSYVLTVTFEYEDEKGNPYTAKETMSVRVLQSPRLVTGQLNMMTETFVGQPISIYLDFYNMGKSTLYNLMVSVEGDFEGQGLNYYVGNFEPGRTDFFDTQFTPMTPGQQKGAVLFAFEDANGKLTEIRKEFDLNVMEMMMEGPMLDENGMPIDGGFEGPWDGGMPGMEGPAKTSIWVYIGIGAGVLVVAVIVIIILRKRHVRRKELSLDE